MRVTPANNVNVDKIKEFLIKHGYRISKEQPEHIVFEKTKFLTRLLWMNIDKPTIEITPDVVLITLDKHTEVILTPLLTYGKKFDKNPD